MASSQFVDEMFVSIDKLAEVSKKLRSFAQTFLADGNRNVFNTFFQMALDIDKAKKDIIVSVQEEMNKISNQARSSIEVVLNKAMNDLDAAEKRLDEEIGS